MQRGSPTGEATPEGPRVVSIRLLGRPSVAIDGRPVAGPRGHKPWALLAHLLLTPRPVGRQQLAELLFSSADDPLRALRWALAELRRGLDGAVELSGDPVSLALADEVTVDVAVLDRAPTDEQLLELDGELLEGVVTGEAAYELWLIAERHRVSSRCEAMHRQATLRLLANGRPADAIAFARRALAHRPLDESNHVLLVRCLAATGDTKRALEHVRISAPLLHSELGVDVSEALRDAALATGGSTVGAWTLGRASVETQLEAGRAAITAGAVAAGLDCLRRAVVDASRCDDRQLEASCLVALGTALVHSVRGADEEGSIALIRAAELADDTGDRAIAASACRELGFVEVQAGRRRTADQWLSTAERCAVDDGELAAILGIRGMNASDAAAYGAAISYLDRSLEHARRAADARQEAWSSSILGRVHLLRNSDAVAEQHLLRSIELARTHRWLAFLPWPQALWGELELRRGLAGSATTTLEASWSLALQLGDPCWEGMAARGLALLKMADTDLDAASGWIAAGRDRCSRVSDRYQWVHAHVLDTAVTIAVRAGRWDDARDDNRALAELAARGEMQEMLVRSLAHDAVLGDPQALEAARRLAAEVDNPVLVAHLDEIGPIG